MSLRRRSRSAFLVDNNDDNVRRKVNFLEPSQTSYSHNNPQYLLSTAQIIVVLICFFAPWIPSFLLQQKVNLVRNEVEKAQQVNEQMLQDLEAALEKKQTLKDSVKLLETSNADMLSQLKRHGNTIDPDNNLYMIAEQDEELFLKRIDELEKGIQRWSILSLEQKYRTSSSSHQEEQHNNNNTSDVPQSLQYRFHWINWQDETSQSFVIETFALEEVGHAVSIFDQTVEQRVLLNSSPRLDTQQACMGITSRKTTNRNKLIKNNKDLPEEKQETMPTQPLAFVELSPSTQMVDGAYNVLIGRKGFDPIVSICAGRVERGLDEGGSMESVLATVVSGTEFLDSLIQPASTNNGVSTTNKGWRLLSIELVNDSSDEGTTD